MPLRFPLAELWSCADAKLTEAIRRVKIENTSAHFFGIDTANSFLSPQFFQVQHNRNDVYEKVPADTAPCSSSCEPQQQPCQSNSQIDRLPDINMPILLCEIQIRASQETSR